MYKGHHQKVRKNHILNTCHVTFTFYKNYLQFWTYKIVGMFYIASPKYYAWAFSLQNWGKINQKGLSNDFKYFMN